MKARILSGLLLLAALTVAAENRPVPDSTAPAAPAAAPADSLPAPASDASAGNSAGVSDLEAFGSVAVLHDGRVKPLETLARHLLLQWSGRSQYRGENGKIPALEVLADVLFAPAKTRDYRLFRIDNPEVAEALGVEAEKRRRYSYRKLEPVLQRLQTLAARADSVEAAKRNLVEQELLRTFSNVLAYLQLSRTMQFALPSPHFTVREAETRKALGLAPAGDASFWELMEQAPTLARILENTGNRAPENRTPMENEVVELSRAMFVQSQTGQPSVLRVLPHPEKAGEWASPAEVVSNPTALRKLSDEVGALAAMAKAYGAGNSGEFTRQAQALSAAVEPKAQAQLAKTHFRLERIYHKADPLFLALTGYWLALLLAFLYFLFRRPWIYGTAKILALAALAVQTAGIVARIVIMQRPPVTSLYETFPFVSAVAIGSALFLERRSRQGVALLSAALLGVILLSIANRYAADGDTMQMLVAVLNSNFWLSTHVITITIGYAACILAGAIAHVRLVWTLFAKPGNPALRETDRMVYGTLCFGLLFSFIGTVLGGIWADQSWGRFWGWDPKENGALLIVIWCAILLHARMFGKIREVGMAAGAVLGAVVVSLAWMGVNLLNVGLHSYGFTTGAAAKLFSYIGGEILFLIVTLGLIRIRGRGRGGKAKPTAQPAAAEPAR